jgi:hypothetical protein
MFSGTDKKSETQPYQAETALGIIPAVNMF